VPSEIATKVRARVDSWRNALTGLGGLRDKATHTRFERRGILGDETLEALFDFDDLAHTIAEAPPKAMLRNGIKVRISENSEAETATAEALRVLEVVPRFLDALILERTYGGAAVFVGADDAQNIAESLNLATLRRVEFLLAIDRRDLRPVAWESNPYASNFGKPTVYELGHTHRTAGAAIAVGSAVRVHASRLVVFEGERASASLRRERQGWGQSSIDRAHTALRTFSANWTSIENLISDASQGVFKVKGLIDMLTSGGKEALLARMEVVDLSRSVARSLLLDSDEESFERKDTSMSGLPELLDRSAQRLSAAARIPVSILLGREPAGLNATGEMDVRSWYDSLGAEREDRLRPRLEELIRLVFLSREGPTRGVEPVGWTLEFADLWTPTPSERADLELKHAQADQIRIASGVLTPEEVALARYKPEGYQDEMSIDASYHAPAVEAFAALAASGTDPLPPTTASGEPLTAPALAPTTGAEPVAPVDPEAKDPGAALNGAQVASLMQIVQAVASRSIPRETGIQLITAAFPIDTAQAEKILGEVGRSFFLSPMVPA
jgi:phage-related protein (TIGR01555 family)